jgi:uncharacterized GH25 family protein
MSISNSDYPRSNQTLKDASMFLHRSICVLLVCVAGARIASAHDAWVQANTNLVRAGDVVHVDLMLGNHGNDHRDFRLAGKVSLDGATLDVVGPDGRRIDLKPTLADTGYAPQEGFWTASFSTATPGMYVVGHASDQVMSYGPVRSVKGAKTCFVVSSSLDNVPRDNPGFDRPLGHPLELVPLASPVTPMGPGVPIRVRLVYKGRPLAGARVSFIPRGTTLDESFDETYERMTDAGGGASFAPTFGNYYLVVAHHLEPEERGPRYDRTKYSATLCVYVPQVCPCCSE